MLYLLALLIGVIAGLRAMTAPAAISWAAALGTIDLEGSWLGFLGWRYTPWILTFLAVAELVTDKLPATPSRKVPVQFGTRILVGAACGAAIGVAGDWLWIGASLGALGALIGTLGGAAARAALAERFGSDRPAAIIEDIVAVGGALMIVLAL
jgi:uncharacterized membrane protein